MDLKTYDHIVINSSGGKDSQTALRVVAQLAAEQGVLDRVTVVHADLGRLEWEGVQELVKEQAAHYGFPVEVVRKQNRAGEEVEGETFLDYVRARKMWPSSSARFCTSDYKRGPCARVITKLAKTSRAAGVSRPRLLNVFGFRAQESPARAKREVFAENKRLSNGAKHVDDWLPIHDWTEDEVWRDIRSSGVRYHSAYDLGMPRLSCCFCIFAPRAALIVAGRANMELLDEYVQLEAEIGHSFRKNQPISEIQAAIDAGESAGSMDGAWNM